MNADEDNLEGLKQNPVHSDRQTELLMGTPGTL